jgi:glycosyltransferase involved in cell wall biosynthesis
MIHDLRAGGAEHVLADLGRVAPEAGIEMSVLSMMPLAGRRYPDVLRDAGVTVAGLDLPTRWDPRALYRARTALRSLAPDVVHSHLKHADLVAARVAPRLGLPMVSTLHLIEDDPGPLGRLKRDLAARARSRAAAATVAVSEATRRWYLESYPQDPQRVVTLHNGVPTPDRVEPRAVTDVRAEFGAGPGVTLAVVIALLRPGKGHEVLVEAATATPDVRFVLAGEGTQEEYLRRETVRRGVEDRVVFAGFRSDVARILAAADLVVHPSLADALPTALIHALAAGTPIVASDVGGIPEIVTGDVGVLVPPGDPAALAAAIDALAGDPGRRAVMAQAGRERFAAEFDGAVWAGRLRRLYRAVMNG